MRSTTARPAYVTEEGAPPGNLPRFPWIGRLTRSVRAAWVALAMVGLAGGALAVENIDPASSDNQYAWGENIGWVNAEPSGQGGPGAEVQDFKLIGWMWGENVGWINLSCQNTGVCATSQFGVVNNGYGVLSGFAWAENIGWINFAPQGCQPDPTCGVRIDPATGYFQGRAWSENTGWVSFSDGGPPAFWTARTSWCQTTGAAPGVGPQLSCSKQPGVGPVCSWAPQAGAAWYDMTGGRLSVLRATQGNFTQSTERCVVSKTAATSQPVPGPAQPGDGFWFIVRGANCRGRGTWDEGASQIGSRDAEIEAAAFHCP